MRVKCYTSYRVPKTTVSSLTSRVVCSSWLDGDLERTAAVHLIERSLVVLEFEDVRDLGQGMSTHKYTGGRSYVPCPLR